MKLNCDDLVRAYAEWLKAKFTMRDLEGVCEITTPFLDRHNDRLQIYVQPTERGLRLTDDGYILGDLEACGCAIETPQRRQLLQVMLAGFGVQQRAGELTVESSVDEFPRKKHALVQAMLAVNDLFLTAKKSVAHLFLEDVAHFLEEHDVRFTQSVEFTGKSGYSHRFDFVIPHTKKSPERVLRAINHPTRENASAFLFAWTDTREVRPEQSVAYAILNDQHGPLKRDVLGAFEEYQVRTIPWSQREQRIQELAA
jgi:hypothetical protein